MQEFWNKRYSESVYAYGQAPNTFFAEQLHTLRPGHLLLPADGEGRNAVYAARHQWHVDAFDYSEAAKEKALTLARQQNVAINYEVADVRHYTFPSNHYQAIGLFFVHLPPELRIFLHNKVVDSLAPGGRLILEAFTPEQLPNTSGGPKNPDMLYSTDLLEKDFQKLDIIKLEQLDVTLSEGPYHQGLANVVRLIAEKK